MTTLLATDLIAALQRHLRVAVSAEISHSWTVRGGAAETVGTEGVLGAQRRDLVGFAGHFAQEFAFRSFFFFQVKSSLQERCELAVVAERGGE